MKKVILTSLVILLVFFCTSGFITKTDTISTLPLKEIQKNKEGKAWWYLYFMKGKTIYITPVFNNNCDHCCNEMREAFKKHLVMNDFDSQASTVGMNCLQDIDQPSLQKRRDDDIYRRKQQNYSIVTVNFSYDDEQK
jgi:hypothetical protein